MQKYSDFAPTGFDPKGLNAEEHNIADYLVFLSRSRDSGILDESNWEVALRELGGESDDVQIHRFGHWACGWFEIILINPNSDKIDEAQELADSLESYPILDESDFSQREYDAAIELGYTWSEDGDGWVDSDGDHVEIDY